MQTYNKVEQDVVAMLTEYFTTCKISAVAKAKLDKDLPSILENIINIFKKNKSEIESSITSATKVLTTKSLREGEPEKPKSAYLIFVDLVKTDLETKLRTENPDFNSKMLREALKEEWKLWKETKKDQVEELKLTANQEMEKYNIEIAEFEEMYAEKYPEEAKKYKEEKEKKQEKRREKAEEKRKETQNKKDLEKQKKKQEKEVKDMMKAKSAFQLYSIDARKEVVAEGKFKGNDITAEVRRRWKDLKAGGGQTILYTKYVEMAKQDKIRAEKFKSNMLTSYIHNKENSDAGELESIGAPIEIVAEVQTTEEPKITRFAQLTSDSDNDSESDDE